MRLWSTFLVVIALGAVVSESNAKKIWKTPSPPPAGGPRTHDLVPESRPVTSINLLERDEEWELKKANYGKDGHSGGWTGPGPAPYNPPMTRAIAIPKDPSSGKLGRILAHGESHDPETEWKMASHKSDPYFSLHSKEFLSRTSSSSLEDQVEGEVPAHGTEEESVELNGGNGVGRGLKGVPNVSGGSAYNIGHIDNAIPADGALCVGPDVILFLTNGRSTLIRKEDIDIPNTYVHENPDSWLPVASHNFDPRCEYDPRSNRFIVIYADGAKSTNSRINIAVSLTSEPLSFAPNQWEMSAWSLVTVQSSGGNRWGDYPTLGISHDYVYLAWVHGNLDDTTVKTVDGTGMHIWSREDIMTDDAQSPSTFQDIEFGFGRPLLTCLPSDHELGSGRSDDVIIGTQLVANSMFAVVLEGAPNLVDIDLKFKTPTTDAPSLRGTGDDFQEFDQRGASTRVDAGQSRVINCGQRGNRYWYSAHGEAKLDDTPRDLPANVMGFLELESNGDVTGITEELAYYQRGLFRGYGYLAGVEDEDGNIVMVYAASSKIEFPSAYLTVVYAEDESHTELAAATAGELDWGVQPRAGHTTIAVPGQSHIAQSGDDPPRWGDYFDITIDRGDDKTIWALVSSSEEGDTTFGQQHLIKVCPSCDLECDPPCASTAKCTKALIGHSCGACRSGYKNPPDCLDQVCDPPCGEGAMCIGEGIDEDPDEGEASGFCVCRPGWAPVGDGCVIGESGITVLEMEKSSTLTHESDDTDKLAIAVLTVEETGKAVELEITRSAGAGKVVVRYEGIPDVGDWSGFEWANLNTTEEDLILIDPAHPGMYYIAVYAGPPGSADASVELKAGTIASTEARELFQRRLVTGLIIFGALAAIIGLIAIGSQFNGGGATGGLDPRVVYGGDGTPPPPRPKQGPGFMARFAAKNAFAVVGEAPPPHLTKKGGSGRKAPPGGGGSHHKNGSGRKAPPRGPSPKRGIPGPAGGGGGQPPMPFIQAEAPPAGAVAGGVPGNYLTSAPPAYNDEGPGYYDDGPDYYDDGGGGGGGGIVGGGDPALGPVRPIPNSPTAGAGRVMTLGTAMKVAGNPQADPELNGGGGGGSKRKAAGGGKKGSKGSKGSRGNRSKKGSNRKAR